MVGGAATRPKPTLWESPGVHPKAHTPLPSPPVATSQANKKAR